MSTIRDVAVVGGGIAGASVAHELAASRSVVLLEAETALGTHSTARSAATWIPGHGVAAVRALITASGPRFAALAAEWDAPPLLAPRPVLWTAFDADAEAALAVQVAERAGEPDAPVPRRSGRGAPAVPGPARGPLPRRSPRPPPTSTSTPCTPPTCAGCGLVAGPSARRHGSWRFAGTARAGGWASRAATSCTAGEIVDAAGAWADRVAVLAGVPPLGLTPLRRTIAVARVPTRRGCDRRTVDRCPWRATRRTAGTSSRRTHLLVSPADETPAEPGDARPDELDVALAVERVEAVTGLGLRSVVTSWAGLRTFVPDRAPVVGPCRSTRASGSWRGRAGRASRRPPALSALAAAVITGTAVPPDVPLDPAALAPTRLTS
jgi:D-arginine dehydrogenase